VTAGKAQSAQNFAATTNVPPQVAPTSNDAPPLTRVGSGLRRIDTAHTLAAPAAPSGQFPNLLSKEQLYRSAYPWMYQSRRLEDRLLELFARGQVKGTVTSSSGNEATAAGAALAFRPGKDVASFLHRDLACHLIFGANYYDLACQYMANANSITVGIEGNVHHGDAASRRFPMISHLGKMLSLVVGGTWQANRQGEKAFGIAMIGDGGTSSGDFHESLNIASVQKVPVVFLVQNNGYSFSTPTAQQYNCERLSDRAVGYGAIGKRIDGLDAWEVYQTITDAMRHMEERPGPAIIECMTIRMQGHAAYDKAEYVPAEEKESNARRDPLTLTRNKLEELGAATADEIKGWEEEINEAIEEAIGRALKVGPPKPASRQLPVYAKPKHIQVKPKRAKNAKNGMAVNMALSYLLENEPQATLLGLDVGPYGSAFKTCKGLVDRFGADRVIDMPLAESATVGFCLGASQIGGRPIMEFQFSDFATEACTQLGLNSGTWYFRAHRPAPMLFRLPCGGGLTMGAFHSGEFEGLWSRFPGLKLLYPATAQETFEALVAGFYDDNPCLVFEHKLLYWSKSGDIDFDGDLQQVWRSRKYTDGTDATVIAFGAMVHEALAAAAKSNLSIEVINPFVLKPLDIDPVIKSVEKTGRLLVCQESGETHGLGDRIISLVTQSCLSKLKCPPQLMAAPDQPVPFAEPYERRHRFGADEIVAQLDRMYGDN